MKTDIKINLRPGQTVIITRAPKGKDKFEHNFKLAEVVEFVRPLNMFGLELFEFTNGKITNVVYSGHFVAL